MYECINLFINSIYPTLFSGQLSRLTVYTYTYVCKYMRQVLK